MATFCDKFTSVDWERVSGYGGKISTVSCVLFGIIGCVIGKAVGINVYTIFLGLIVAVLELPVIYACIEPCRKLRVKLLEDCRCKNGWLRGIVYIGLSIVCYLGTSIAILPGLLLGLTGLVYFFFAYSESVNAREAAQLKQDEVGTSPYQKVQDKFGTF